MGMQLVHMNTQEIKNLDKLQPGQKIPGTDVKSYGGMAKPFEIINEEMKVTPNNEHMHTIMRIAKEKGATPIHLDNHAINGLRDIHKLIHDEDVEHDFSGLKSLFSQPHIAHHLKTNIEQKRANGGVVNDYISTLKQHGRGGDSQLALVPNELVHFLDDSYSLGTTNPQTGHKEYFLGKMFDSLGSIFRPVKDAFGSLFGKKEYKYNGGADVPAENPWKTPQAATPQTSSSGNPFGSSGRPNQESAPTSSEPSWLQSGLRGLGSAAAGFGGQLAAQQGASAFGAPPILSTAIGNAGYLAGSGKGRQMADNVYNSLPSASEVMAVPGRVVSDAYNSLPSMSDIGSAAYNMLPSNPFASSATPSYQAPGSTTRAGAGNPFADMTHNPYARPSAAPTRPLTSIPGMPGYGSHDDEEDLSHFVDAEGGDDDSYSYGMPHIEEPD